VNRIEVLKDGGGAKMSNAAERSKEVLDRSVLASLKELQEEGDPDIIEEVGGLFLEHAPEKIAAIRNAASKKDAKALQLSAHSLKSSSAYVGAMRLSEMSKDLEIMGRLGSLEGAEGKVENLITEFSLVKAALEKEIRGEI
jgi:HPt (histidine-containing phosphotransfer) domain-containing protein